MVILKPPLGRIAIVNVGPPNRLFASLSRHVPFHAFDCRTALLGIAPTIRRIAILSFKSKIEFITFGTEKHHFIRFANSRAKAAPRKANDIAARLRSSVAPNDPRHSTE